MKNYKKGNVAIAISIIVAGIIIAGAVVLTKGDSGSRNVANNNQAQGGHNAANAGTQEIKDFRLPNKDDHLLGNPDAKVTIVEFSDFECPFCSRLHPTLTRLIKERSDDVNWVYRHFPLSSIHNNALSAAIASECVANLSGNDAFWQFTDALFNNQRGLNTSLYENEASKLGVNLDDFRSCLGDKKTADSVTEDLNEALGSGGRGTPFSVAVTPSGELLPFSGALPYDTISSLVDQALEN